MSSYFSHVYCVPYTVRAICAAYVCVFMHGLLLPDIWDNMCYIFVLSLTIIPLAPRPSAIATALTKVVSRDGAAFLVGYIDNMPKGAELLKKAGQVDLMGQVSRELGHYL